MKAAYIINGVGRQKLRAIKNIIYVIAHGGGAGGHMHGWGGGNDNNYRNV